VCGAQLRPCHVCLHVSRTCVQVLALSGWLGHGASALNAPRAHRVSTWVAFSRQGSQSRSWSDARVPMRCSTMPRNQRECQHIQNRGDAGADVQLLLLVVAGGERRVRGEEERPMTIGSIHWGFGSMGCLACRQRRGMHASWPAGERAHAAIDCVIARCALVVLPAALLTLLAAVTAAVTGPSRSHDRCWLVGDSWRA